YPKITGSMYDRRLGKIQFATYFLGFNLLYFPLFLAWETPRRVFDYSPELLGFHRAATVGGLVLGLSFLLMFYNMAKSLWDGEKAADNPWRYASSAEWAIPSPPPLENFPGIPNYTTGTLSFLERGSGEITDGGVATGEHAHTPSTEGHHASHASYWPILIALSLFVAFLGLSGLQQGAYPGGLEGIFYMAATGVGLVGILGTIIGLSREHFVGPENPSGGHWPFEKVSDMKLGVWMFLTSDIVLFGTFIAAFVFLRANAGWTTWEPVPHNPIPGLVNTYLLLTSSFAVVLALVAAERNSKRGVAGALFATFALGAAFLINKAIEWQELFHEGVVPTLDVQTSTFYVTTGLHAAHVFVGMVFLLYMFARATRGAYLDDDRPIEYFGLYWHFVDIVWLFLFPLFYIL
ncbi:MAG: cytochrome c oxidase subunit 3, partial [archaeon]